jgi:uncharacterized protein
MMNSRLYEGIVSHRRLVPIAHAFRYRLFMVYLDLDELDDVFRGRWLWSARRPAPAWFRRRDHVGDPKVPLADTVRNIVHARVGHRPAGPIRLLTNLRYFGYCFNPVSFYYCFHPDGSRVEAVVAEVHNTPWGETHCYVLADGAAPPAGPGAFTFRHAKAFHVSPFMPMEQEYHWRVTEPGEQLSVSIVNAEGGTRVHESALVLRRVDIGAGSLARVLARYPLMTARITVAIYWQALLLWRKRIPVFAHPAGTGTLQV